LQQRIPPDTIPGADRFADENGAGGANGFVGIHVPGDEAMRVTTRYPLLFGGLFVLTSVVAGCENGFDRKESPEEAAREAVGTKERRQERTTEAKRDVIVEDTTKVIDRDTGQVLKTEQTKTPVTVTEEKTTEHDLNVRSGESQKTVK
jgi:hypothetical protein